MKYNDEMINKLEYIIGFGLAAKAACGIVNISEKTFYEWVNEYPEFKERMEAAKDKRELTLLKEVYEQCDTKDRLSLLRMLYPKYNVSNVKLSGDASNPVAINSNLGINKERLKELVKEGYTLDEIMDKL